MIPVPIEVSLNCTLRDVVVPLLGLPVKFVTGRTGAEVTMTIFSVEFVPVVLVTVNLTVYMPG